MPDFKPSTCSCLRCGKTAPCSASTYTKQPDGSYRPVNQLRPDGWIAGPAALTDVARGLCFECSPGWTKAQDEYLASKPAPPPAAAPAPEPEPPRLKKGVSVHETPVAASKPPTAHRMLDQVAEPAPTIQTPPIVVPPTRVTVTPPVAAPSSRVAANIPPAVPPPRVSSSAPAPRPNVTAHANIAPVTPGSRVTPSPTHTVSPQPTKVVDAPASLVSPNANTPRVSSSPAPAAPPATVRSANVILPERHAVVSNAVAAPSGCGGKVSVTPQAAPARPTVSTSPTLATQAKVQAPAISVSKPPAQVSNTPVKAEARATAQPSAVKAEKRDMTMSLELPEQNVKVGPSAPKPELARPV